MEIIEFIKEIIDNYTVEIVLGLAIGLVFLLVLFIIYIYKTNKSIKRYNKLLNGSKDINIEELLSNINKNVNNMNSDMSEMETNISDIKIRLDFAIRKVGFIKYNAFDDIGSELSFSIALLDGWENGFVLTSIYGRNGNVIYSKAIKNGTSNTHLSEEEILAINRAIKSKVHG